MPEPPQPMAPNTTALHRVGSCVGSIRNIREVLAHTPAAPAIFRCHPQEHPALLSVPHPCWTQSRDRPAPKRSSGTWPQCPWPLLPGGHYGANPSHSSTLVAPNCPLDAYLGRLRSPRRWARAGARSAHPHPEAGPCPTQPSCLGAQPRLSPSPPLWRLAAGVVPSSQAQMVQAVAAPGAMVPGVAWVALAAGLWATVVQYPRGEPGLAQAGAQHQWPQLAPAGSRGWGTLQRAFHLRGGSRGTGLPGAGPSPRLGDTCQLRRFP